MTFAYHEPSSLESAIALKKEHGSDATVVSGGIAFLLLLRAGLVDPVHVVGLRRIPELRGIEQRPDGLWIGAHTTHAEIAQSPLVAAAASALRDACSMLGNVRVRAQGTIAGNGVHADPAQDPAPALLSVEATVELCSSEGTRVLPLEEFLIDHYVVALKDDEIVRGFLLPYRPDTSVYTRFVTRTSDDYPTVSLAVSMTHEDHRLVKARLAMGSLAPTAVRARTVEDALLEGASARDAAAQILNDISPYDDIRASARYRTHVATIVIERTLTSLLGPA